MDSHLNKELFELEAIADLLIAKGEDVKRYITNARKKLGGVSTPPVRKGSLSAKEKAKLLARRKATILKAKHNHV